MNTQTANEPVPSSIQSGQCGVENACEFLQILWCIHNDLLSAIDLHPSAGQEAVHKLQPVDLKKPVYQSESHGRHCVTGGDQPKTFLSSCTVHSSCHIPTAPSFHPVHPSLHTLHSHSILFTHHFTLCTVVPICIVHLSLHTLHSHSILFTHHFTFCTVISICIVHLSFYTLHILLCIVHPSLHTLHSHFNLHCSPITSHSAQSFQSALFTHHFTLCTLVAHNLKHFVLACPHNFTSTQKTISTVWITYK